MQLPHVLHQSVSNKCHAFRMVSHIRPPHVISRSDEKFIQKLRDAMRCYSQSSGKEKFQTTLVYLCESFRLTSGV